VLAPSGAWIPPTPEPERLPGLAFEGGRPILDAADALSHNESLFHGAWTWGTGTALALIVLGMIWVRGFRS